MELSGLDVGEVYSFSLKYLTEVGSTPPSQESLTFNTAPVSPPTMVVVSNVTTTALTITWELPIYFAQQVELSGIYYKIIVEGEDSLKLNCV